MPRPYGSLISGYRRTQCIPRFGCVLQGSG